MWDCDKLECQVSERSKYRENFKFAKLFISQSKNFTYDFCIVMFKELKYSNVKKLCKAVGIKRKLKQNHFAWSSQLMKKDSYIWPIVFDDQK